MIYRGRCQNEAGVVSCQLIPKPLHNSDTNRSFCIWFHIARAPRVNIDIVPDAAGMVGPESPPFPAGASASGDHMQAPCKGHYHQLLQGTILPADLGVAADGIDVHVNSPYPATHHTIYPKNQVLLIAIRRSVRCPSLGICREKAMSMTSQTSFWN